MVIIPIPTKQSFSSIQVPLLVLFNGPLFTLERLFLYIVTFLNNFCRKYYVFNISNVTGTNNKIWRGDLKVSSGHRSLSEKTVTT